jgi:hypothetical protein
MSGGGGDDDDDDEEEEEMGRIKERGVLPRGKRTWFVNMINLYSGPSVP